jgi:2-polyprenyl-3-methyl-5-hydroxy-6-metoxy-1,4-benzoquinol methylase
MESHEEHLSDIERYIRNHDTIPLSDKLPHFENLLRYIRPFVEVGPNLEMLEVGTGMGWVPALAKQRGLRLRGLEISPVLAEAARQYGLKHGVELDIIVGNMETYELGENEYDVIIANSVFEHVEHWEIGLRRLHRALKPGGILFFESTNKFSVTSGEYPPMPFYGVLPDALRYRFRMLIHGRDIMKNGIDFHQFTYPLLRQAFRQAGFSRYYDRVELVNPAEVSSPLRRRVLEWCKNSRIIKEIVLTFFESTTFICVK